MTDPNDSIDSEGFATTVPLTNVFGNHPKTLLVSAMLSESVDPETHFSVNELSRISDLDADVVEEHVLDLQTVGVVAETDELDDAATYTLDESTDVAEDLRRLYQRLYEMPL